MITCRETQLTSQRSGDTSPPGGTTEGDVALVMSGIHKVENAHLLSSHGETNHAMDLLHFEFLGENLKLGSPVSYNQARRGDRLFVGSRVIFVSYRREARSVVGRRL